jgi:xylan 1,4-beta-xylosidase
LRVVDSGDGAGGRPSVTRLGAEFVSTHHYPNDPLWSEAQDTESELAGGTRGILRDWAAAARQQARGRPLLYTEWNVSSNPRYPRQDDPYAAAFAVKSALEVSSLVEAYAFWTFTDLFEENYFPSLPFHGGFGLLSLHGIAKPTYRAFELLRRLGDEQLPTEGNHETVDAWAVRKGADLTIVLTNHALPQQPIGLLRVRVELEDAPPPRSVTLERIDEGLANAKAAWLALRSPEYPGAAEIRQMEESSRLVGKAHGLRAGGPPRVRSVEALTQQTSPDVNLPKSPCSSAPRFNPRRRARISRRKTARISGSSNQPSQRVRKT